MRLKRKISYSVKIPNHWYYPKLKKWIHEDILMNDNENNGLMITNIIHFKTCKVFKKHWPVNTIITKSAFSQFLLIKSFILSFIPIRKSAFATL